MKKNTVLTALLLACALTAGAAVNVSAWESQLEPDGITASSYLPASDYGNYVPWNLCDYDWSTAWVENASGNGEGESITFTFPEGTILTGGMIVNGYCKSEALYYKNAAPSSLTCTVNGKKCKIDLSTVSDDYNNACEGFTFEFPSEVEAETVTFTINEVRPGTAYQDTCITELHLLGAYPVYHSYTMVSEELAAMEIDDSMVLDLENEMYVLYRRRSKDILQDLQLPAEELNSDERGLLTYWYQYFFGLIDDRIWDGMEFNTVTYELAQQLMREVCGSCSEQDMDVFCRSYTIEQDSDTLSMYATGDFGDAGRALFRYGFATRDGDQIRIDGEICEYREESSSYETCGAYTAWFDLEPAGENILRTFRRLEVKVNQYG